MRWPEISTSHAIQCDGHAHLIRTCAFTRSRIVRRLSNLSFSSDGRTLCAEQDCRNKPLSAVDTRVLSRRRDNSVAFGAKRTFSEPRFQTEFISTHPNTECRFQNVRFSVASGGQADIPEAGKCRD